MKKSIQSRQTILEYAFRLFGTYSYPDVSFSLLEEASGMSRGSMVYYFKNKEGIFRAVLDTYMHVGNVVEPAALGSEHTLIDFINFYISVLETRQKSLASFNLPNLAFAKINIEMSAIQYVPDFKERCREGLAKERERWHEELLKAQESGEIRSGFELDVLASQFQTLRLGYSLRALYENSADSLTSLRDSYMLVYRGIKS